MKITGLHYAHYRLPLTHAFVGGGVDVAERRGLLVRMESEGGGVGYGEIAPLPGLHTETLREAESRLKTIGPSLRDMAWDSLRGSALSIAEAAAKHPDTPARACPSVVFGLEMAAAGLLARANDTTPAALLGTTGRREVPINALFTGTAEDAERPATISRLERYPALKVKIGRRSETEDRAVLQQLHAHLPASTLLRIDGNRGLTPEALKARLQDLPRERVAYLEEPLADPAQLAGLSAEIGIGIGLDETLRDDAMADLSEAACVRAWILKPSTLGSWERISILAERGAAANKAIVISSALESGLGLGHLAQMAAALPGADVPAGLATETWLAEDLIAPRYDSSAGEIVVAEWVGAPAASIEDALDWHSLT